MDHQKWLGMQCSRPVNLSLSQLLLWKVRTISFYTFVLVLCLTIALARCLTLKLQVLPPNLSNFLLKNHHKYFLFIRVRFQQRSGLQGSLQDLQELRFPGNLIGFGYWRSESNGTHLGTILPLNSLIFCHNVLLGDYSRFLPACFSWTAVKGLLAHLIAIFLRMIHLFVVSPTARYFWATLPTWCHAGFETPSGMIILSSMLNFIAPVSSPISRPLASRLFFRTFLRFLVEHKMVDCIVTTAGGVEEDLIKCLAKTYVGDFHLDGRTLRDKAINRIGRYHE